MTDAEIIAKAKAHLDGIKIDYYSHTEHNFIVTRYEKGDHRDKGEISLITVVYQPNLGTLDTGFHIMVFDGTTYEIDYIITSHGYIETEPK